MLFFRGLLKFIVNENMTKWSLISVWIMPGNIIFESLVILLSMMVFEFSVTRVGIVIVGNALLPNIIFKTSFAEGLEDSGEMLTLKC